MYSRRSLPGEPCELHKLGGRSGRIARYLRRVNPCRAHHRHRIVVEPRTMKHMFAATLHPVARRLQSLRPCETQSCSCLRLPLRHAARRRNTPTLRRRRRLSRSAISSTTTATSRSTSKGPANARPTATATGCARVRQVLAAVRHGQRSRTFHSVTTLATSGMKRGTAAATAYARTIASAMARVRA